MSIDVKNLRARVDADLPWHAEQSSRGILRIDEDALVLERTEPHGTRIAIPLASISRASVETTFGLLPALHVRHQVEGKEVRSRFEFGEEDDDQDAAGPRLANNVGPGLARDAAQRLEGGLRALSSGLNQGKRAARQAVGGLARQDEYRIWPAAIAQAQADATRAAPASASTAARASASAPLPPIVPPGARTPEGDAATVLAWFCDQGVRWIAACGERAKALGVRNVPVIQADYPLDSKTCRIVVAGEFSRGKSTVINALFGIHGEIALPTGMTPTTPLACAIRVPRVGESDGATVSYRTNRAPLHLSLDEFRTRVRLAEEGDETTREQAQAALHLEEARRVEVRVTGAYLPAGVEVEDTPGLNEQAGRSAGALAALGRADLILFVLAADQLLGDLERDVIENTLARGYHRNVIFLVNFWENIDDDEQRAVLRQRAEALLGGFPTPFSAAGQKGHGEGEAPARPHILYISALQAARAQRQRKQAPEESGILHLRALLRDLLGPQSSAVLLRARTARALRYIALLRTAVSQTLAATTLDAGSSGMGSAHAEAAAAAIRVLDGLDGAVDGATARCLAAVRELETPGLRRVATLIESSEEQRSSAAWQEARRALASELRVAAAECANAAQQAVDLVLAQARAAYPARGLPAPLLDGRVEPASIPVPSQGRAMELAAVLHSAAFTLQEATRAAVEQLRASVVHDMRAAAPSRPASAAARTDARQEAERRARRAALQTLEDDLAHLAQLLQPILHR